MPSPSARTGRAGIISRAIKPANSHRQERRQGIMVQRIGDRARAAAAFAPMLIKPATASSTGNTIAPDSYVIANIFGGRKKFMVGMETGGRLP